jgi:hypothetical protein
VVFPFPLSFLKSIGYLPSQLKRAISFAWTFFLFSIDHSSHYRGFLNNATINIYFPIEHCLL